MILFYSLFFLAGCLKFGPDAETVNPTVDQVSQCRRLMYLSPKVRIKPLGFKSVYGIDNAMWLKFSTDVHYHDQLFSFPDSAEVRQLQYVNDLLPINVYWWDVDVKKLDIRSYGLPNGCYMDVGLDEKESETVVYIFWHET